MAIVWTDYSNGESLLTVRTNINSFNNSVVSDVNTNTTSNATNATNIATNTSDITTNTSDIATNTSDIATNTSDIITLQGPKDYVRLTPQVTPLSPHVIGQIYFDEDSGTTRIQGGIPGVEVEVGHGEHIHVVNNTGAIIPKGAACRHDGVASGKVQAALAIATSFDNARVFGLASQEIGIGDDGALTTSGEIRDMDTNGLPVGIPLYLSDTNAGEYTSTIPGIVSQVGGAITADAITGRFYVQTINNSNLPTVLGGVQGQTVGNDTYTLTGTPQDINDYALTETIVMGVDALNGVLTLSNTGNYRMHFTADISFTSLTSTRSVIVEFYDITNTTSIFGYTKNIPRDATEDSFSFNIPFSSVLGTEYKMRVYASTTMDVTFEDISFDIESINII